MRFCVLRATPTVTGLRTVKTRAPEIRTRASRAFAAAVFLTRTLTAMGFPTVKNLPAKPMPAEHASGSAVAAANRSLRPVPSAPMASARATLRVTARATAATPPHALLIRAIVLRRILATASIGYVRVPSRGAKPWRDAPQPTGSHSSRSIAVQRTPWFQSWLGVVLGPALMTLRCSAPGVGQKARARRVTNSMPTAAS